MYENFFNLSADPFRLSPDHRFCYKHPRYARARAYMAYAFRRAEGFVMVTGQPGTGKTTLIGDMVEYLAGENVAVANLVSTQHADDDMLLMVGHAIDAMPRATDKTSILPALQNRFLAWHRAGRRALLIVDEAQDLRAEAMEELRLLTNMQHDGRPLLQIFLLGQPGLRQIIHDSAMEPVHQRIVAATHLEALSEEETRAYVEHRLKVVGWKGDPAFSTPIFPIIHRFSGGVPRRINLFCCRLLLHACVEQKHRIAVADARVVAGELQEEQLSTRDILGDDLFQVRDDFGAARPGIPAGKRQHVRPVRAVPTAKVEAAPKPAPKPVAKPGGSAPRASFEARNLTRRTPGVAARTERNTVNVYTGVERRRSNRRSGHDRRKELRLEIGREDRRKSLGRRRDDTGPKRW